MIGDAIFLTTSEVKDESQSLVKFDRDTGQLVDRWVIHRGTLPARIHPNNSHASPTPAFDGENLLVAFHTDDAIWVTSITLDGRENWKKRVADFEPHTFQFGYGASPLIEDDLVIIAAEYNGADSGLYALDLRTGKEIWKVARPSNLNFTSPIAATIAGQRQVMLAGADTIAAYDPRTGKQFWSIQSSTEAICGTIVWDGRRVLISGGNPRPGTWCVQGDGTEVALWDNRVKCYEQSLLTIKNYVFAAADNGVAYCWNTRDGAEMWKKRLFSGAIDASPLLANDRVYIATQSGKVYVVAASPHRFELLAENQSGNSIFATPVAIDDRIYLRTGVSQGGNRQEFLVAIGRKTQKP
jgi:outer membrane protein assembly factor BamB